MSYNEVRLNKLNSYLKKKGWAKSTFDNYLDKISLKDGSKSLFIVIPKEEDLLDYSRRIRDIVYALSIIENRSENEIIDDIINFGYDVFKMRFISKKFENGTIPIEYANQAIKHISDMIKYGACSEINPQSRYKRPYKEAKDLIENCELAQTEKGSFIIKVRVPLDEIYLKDMKKDEMIKDLGRKTISRLITGIEDAKKLDLSDEKEFEEKYDEKLNKNICEAVSKLLVEKEGAVSLEISAKWNPNKDIEKKLQDFTKIDSDNYYQKFKRMSIYLQKIPDTREALVEGFIHEMKREDEGLKTEKRLIRLYAKNLKRMVCTRLAEKDYKKACDAHKNKKEIKLKGTLRQSDTGRWFLDKPRYV